MARIYLSSTYNDLKEYREVVYRTLRQLAHDAVAMEDYVASDTRPLDKCLQDVATSDLYIGIFAFQYGYIPDHDNPAHKSITELEYRKAGLIGVPRLVFLVKDGAAWPTTFVDALNSGDGGRRIADLRNELKKEHLDSFFESIDELARKVSVAVQLELQRAPAERIQIDWAAPNQQFIHHMRLFAGARSGQEAFNRYHALRLQATHLQNGGSTLGNRGDLPVGTWRNLVSYPGKILITGESGSGKTTLLLHEAQRLSIESRDIPCTPLPLYLSLRTFTGGNADTLLEMAAEVNKIDPSTLSSLWSEPRLPICLLLDGGDETAYREKLIDAILQLAEALSPAPGAAGLARQEVRSLVVACRPGPLHARMTAPELSWREFLLMPLSDADIDSMLTLYDAAPLIPFLSARLRQTLRQPDLLSALAQSARDRRLELLPRNAAEIYDLYFRHIFATAGGDYDYERIKLPILSRIAYDMLRTNQNAIACDDSLYGWMASDLENLYRQYYRRRRVMPHDWSAEELHDELLRSPVVDMASGGGEMITFSRAFYRDYFVAVHLASMGVAAQEARDLMHSFTNGEQLQPLSFLLEMKPESASLFDALPASALPAATQIWLEDGGRHIQVPEIISSGYLEKCETVRSKLFDLSDLAPRPEHAPLSHHPDPRQRFQSVSALAELRPLPVRLLLEAADDDHALVRAIAQSALLHSGEPRPSLQIGIENGHFMWRSHGGGVARIGPLKLLDVPVPMLLDLTVNIEHLDIDPFQVDTEFSFLPMSPALFAADLFSTRAVVDWLELLAHFHDISQVSADLANRASHRPRLAAFAQRLASRAGGYSAVGRLLSSDLGLQWEELPTAVEETAPTPGQTYSDLRHMFSRVNQARTLRLARIADDSTLDATQSIDQVHDGGTAVGIQIDRLEGSAFDETVKDTQRFVFVNSSRNVRAAAAGAIYGIEINYAGGSWHELPLTVHLDDSMNIDQAIDSEVNSILVHTLASVACPWRVTATVNINRFANSRYRGVIVEDYRPKIASDRNSTFG
jgi:hypothetical protein